ncbi:MAG TPA: ATP-binding protein [Mesorhizobium sp.]|jgi:PAS domain S-box-containing protein|nr:ATP-binding protein [Mesorhizobium sp.]
MIETRPLSLEPGLGQPSPAVLAAQALRRLKNSRGWGEEIGDILAMLARGLGCHRAILFRLRDVPGRGFVQSVASFWLDPAVPVVQKPPTVISRDLVESDPFLERLAEELRQGKMFVGHTDEIEGFLRRDFEAQGIRSFMSAPVFAYGQVWGTLAFNDCLARHPWSDDERAVLELVAAAIGEAVEREASEEHVSDHIRRAMLQSSLDAIIVIDETGAIVEFNPAAESMFGWSREEILGKDVLDMLIPDLYRAGYGSGGAFMEGMGGAILGNRIETLGLNRGGETLPLEFTATELRFADRRLFLGSIRDLSEKRRAEEEIEHQRERLHQNEKLAAMGSLLAGVSHELNNPLAVVVAQSTLLYEFAADPQTRSRAEKVRAAAERCGRIVKSFLGMVRLQPSAPVAADLNAIVRAAMEVTAYGARSSGIAIESDFSALPLRVLADPDHLTQVAANLLVNSQHALSAQNGERRIHVGSFSRGGMCGFTIADNGPGVPPEVRARMFEPYFTTKAVGVGTGIGLSISRSIVERYGGRIWLDDEYRDGARFVVELPAHGAERARADEAAAQAQSGAGRAVIIDDERDVASSLGDMLQLMGVEARVVPAWTSVEADLVGGPEPGMVFCDLRMPGASGISIFREISAKRPALGKRFVLVTGDMLGARNEIEALKPADRPLLLEKPFGMLDVRNILAALAERSPAP